MAVEFSSVLAAALEVHDIVHSPAGPSSVTAVSVRHREGEVHVALTSYRTEGLQRTVDILDPEQWVLVVRR